MSEPGGSSVRAVYEQRRARFEAERERLGAQSRRVSHLRAITFVLVMAAGLVLERNAGVPAALLVAVTIAAFVALVAVHRRLASRESWQRELAALNEAGVHRLERAWDRLP